MKLEVGMHVRTREGIGKVVEHKKHESWGYLVKIIGQYSCYTHTSNGELPDVIKASHNIIDLIEAGDIIEVNEFKGNYEVKQFGLELSIIKDEYIYNLNSLHCKLNIKSIVTKQQFESMKYEVKEDE